ncbi:hypothetical protein ACKI2N_002455 [Cupriavidus sp. 30B13]|uniref:hypothetical protein n=1 Tax=Cupriavidus sp. 30B13 TaxID=3384241 RepID=UPI003B91684D
MDTKKERAAIAVCQVLYPEAWANGQTWGQFPLSTQDTMRRAACAAFTAVATDSAAVKLTDDAVVELKALLSEARATIVQCTPVSDQAMSDAFLGRIDAALDTTPPSAKVLDEVMKERDDYHDMADRLAAAIGEHLGVDVGEHSSGNCPWTAALEALDGHQDSHDAARFVALMGAMLAYINDEPMTAEQQAIQAAFNVDRATTIDDVRAKIDAATRGS